MRARIIQALRGRPMNAHQLATLLHVDYSTVRHHLDILVDHQIAERVGGSYGSAYFLSSQVLELYSQVGPILDKMGKRYTVQLAHVRRPSDWLDFTG